VVAHIKKSIPHQRRGSLFACDGRTGLDRQLETETDAPQELREARHAYVRIAVVKRSAHR
jgi:1,2-phenylacetyl-CoA epoxidase PaaB subunit